MKIKVNIFLGMLGSGKTTVINSLINSDKHKDENILIIQDESGRNEIDFSKRNKDVIVLKTKTNEGINAEVLKGIIKTYYPTRILIECNSMKGTEAVIKIFNDKSIKNKCILEKVVCTVDGKTANMYMMNMGDIISEPILYSDILILNNTENMNKKAISDIKKNIKQINEVASFVNCNGIEDIKKLISVGKIDITCQSKISKYLNNSVIGILIIILGLLLAITLKSFNADKLSVDMSMLLSFNSIFIGIIIESIPFILLGSFVSSIIQIFISEENILRFFPKNRLLSCVMASLLGVLFPVCDCGTIPLARGFAKKGMNFSGVISFMLAAPIVNPIAIMSTIYAFPKMKAIVIYRVLIGMIISIVAGLIMGRKPAKEVLVENMLSCDCGLCNGGYDQEGSLISKIRMVFIYAGEEFFKVGKYMIIGGLMATTMQIFISKTSFSSLSGSPIGSVLTMIAFSFIFSVCSTSDAFVAKGFVSQFSLNSVLGFLVLGPMINIKNTMMLLGSFKTNFILKLFSIVILIASIILVNIRI
ncbi:permease [Clostridium sp. LP20]|uniref:permease n=1 Tax=Clostridium sp. LP20 TaxID=3418665 RepID=UPI003EE7F514